MTKTKELCAAYSAQAKIINQHQHDLNLIESLLDEQCAELQKEFRRKLSKAVRPTHGTVMLARCWHLVQHGKFPVSVFPVASATILARKGVEIRITFEAKTENITTETAKLAAALEALK